MSSKSPNTTDRGSAALRLSELEEIELTIDKLVAGGDGFGRFEGIPIFVPLSAPGDRLRVRLVSRHPDYGRGEIEEILAPGPARRQPPCPYFGRCGGCSLQHIDDRSQVALKAEAACETLIRLGGVRLPDDLRIVEGSPWGYRLRTQLHCERREQGAAVGYFARGSHELVAVDRCPILTPALEELLPRIPSLLPEDPPHRLDIAVSDDGRVGSAPPLGTLGEGELSIALGEDTLFFDARCFFQGHRGLLPELVEAVVGTEQGRKAYDLYAGVGLFSLPLARNYERVVAVEVDRVAARFCRLNARRNHRAGVEVVSRAVESWIGMLPEGAERVVVDPPRAGLAKRVVEVLLARRPAALTYVSCHAASLARDLGRLSGAYRIDRLVLLDLFPQSGHLELVAHLRSSDAAQAGENG